MSTEPGGLDAGESSLAELVKEAFPQIEAVWHAPWLAPSPVVGMSGPWSEITRQILRCVGRAAASDAIAADAIIGPAIGSGQLYVGSSGSGSVYQAEVLPVELVNSACVELASRGFERTERHLTEIAIGNLRKLRTGIAGDHFDGWMLTAFSGIKISPYSAISTPWGSLVHADRMSSEMWGPEGCSAVLTTPIRSFLRPTSTDPSTFAFIPEAQQLSIATQRIAQLVSYGVALGSAINDPSTAIPVSLGELLPTGRIGTSGSFRMTGFQNRSTPLTDDEIAEAAQWMVRLDGLPLDRIDVALRRLVRGLAERRDYQDSLIDAVIAWENLVENRDYPTKSVIDGIATLTSDAGWSKNNINKIYRARSEVIHGETPDFSRCRDAANEALRVGLDALRSLFDHHPDTLQMTSEERGEALGFVAGATRPPARAWLRRFLRPFQGG